MNKLERMTGIMLVISRRGRIRAHELAGLFEVSERTIYRDVQALSELGVPVAAETGSGGGYSLAPGFIAQPVVLDTEECQAIYLGCDFVGSQRDFPLAAAARRALLKLEAVMPRDRQERAREVLGRVSWELPHSIQRDGGRILDILRQGVLEHRSVDILYAPLAGEPQWRIVDVYELNFAGTAWYIQGHCHLRNDLRRFKVLRILDCRLRDDCFSPRDYTQEQARPEGPDMVVRAPAQSARARMLAEDPVFAPLLSEGEDYFTFTFPAREFSQSFVVRFVLGLGQDGELVSPPDLRQQVAGELRQILRNYKQQS